MAVSTGHTSRIRKDRPVGIAYLRELFGAKFLLNVSQAILVTSSIFTKEAIEFAKSRNDITLIDISSLLSIIRVYSPNEETKENRIDRNFFSCFVSYSHKDELFVGYLIDKLKEKGIRVWYAPEDLKAGQNS